MQTIQKSYVTVDTRIPQPINDEVPYPDEIIKGLIHPLSRQQNAVYRNKVLTRKRKRSKHPLRELRIRAGYTLEELADITHMSPSYLSRLESGTRRLNADILHRLSLALSCSAGDLLPYNNNYGLSRSTESEEPSTSITLNKDLPVYCLTGTTDHFGEIHADVAEQWITRPVELLGVIGAFACMIKEANFGPRYHDGDRILLHPTAPLSSQCSVLAVTNDNQAYIGRFVGWQTESATSNPSKLTLDIVKGKQDESPKTQRIIFDQEQLKGTYRIIGSFEAA